MTAPGLPDRDGAQVDALVADRYLDALLAAGDRHATDAPADASLDPELREAARVLRRALVRVHPSFRFEERLASRLADLAAAQAAPALAASGGGTLVAFPTAAASGIEDPLLDAILAGELDPTDAAAFDRDAAAPDRRPLLVGGAAITSAALSIAGVAFVAWRATRPGARGGARATDAMTRAVRAVQARRATGLADLAELATAGLAAAGVPGTTLTGGSA